MAATERYMPDHELVLAEINLREINDQDCVAYWELSERMRAEILPDDPPVPYALFAARTRSMPTFFEARALLARESPGGPLIAASDFNIDTSGDNAHAAWVSIDVLPEHRRRGLGRRLLAWAADLASERGRRLLFLSDNDRMPAGALFLQRIGASRGIEERNSQLVLADVDRDLLSRWQADAADTAAGFELIFWDNTYPAEHIDAYADLCDVMNTEPRDNLEIEDQKMTAAKLREYEQSRRSRGSFVWIIIAREVSSGTFVGYTELIGIPSSPTILYQGATAVRPEYRGHRLGRWMKAAMLDRALAGLPGARFVRTGNASSNAPMLAINIDLGFKPYMISTIWQLDVEKARAYAN
jgi:GNAT superfamily N-acetyltransferase